MWKQRVDSVVPLVCFVVTPMRPSWTFCRLSCSVPPNLSLICLATPFLMAKSWLMQCAIGPFTVSKLALMILMFPCSVFMVVSLIFFLKICLSEIRILFMIVRYRVLSFLFVFFLHLQYALFTILLVLHECLFCWWSCFVLQLFSRRWCWGCVFVFLFVFTVSALLGYYLCYLLFYQQCFLFQFHDSFFDLL